MHSGHCAEFPPGGGFPVLRDRLHCLQSCAPHFLQLKWSEEAQPDEYLHISNYDPSNKSSLKYWLIQSLESDSNQFCFRPSKGFHLSKNPLYRSRMASTGGTTLRLKPLILTASLTLSNLFLWSRLICRRIFSYQSVSRGGYLIFLAIFSSRLSLTKK